MVYTPVNNSVSGIEQGTFAAYEIKSCMADLCSGHGLNLTIADYNYIYTTTEVWNKIMNNREILNSIGYHVGVYADGVCVKNARRHNRTKPLTEMLLMMFRSANRENIKVRNAEHRDTFMLDYLQKRVEYLQSYIRDQWILVTEQLPEEKENPITMDYYEYPVTVKYGDTYDIRYYKYGDNHWWCDGKIVDESVIAWKPLEPYKEKETKRC